MIYFFIVDKNGHPQGFNMYKSEDEAWAAFCELPQDKFGKQVDGYHIKAVDIQDCGRNMWKIVDQIKGVGYEGS